MKARELTGKTSVTVAVPKTQEPESRCERQRESERGCKCEGEHECEGEYQSEHEYLFMFMCCARLCVYLFGPQPCVLGIIFVCLLLSWIVRVPSELHVIIYLL